jgi:hypothetical protein
VRLDIYCNACGLRRTEETAGVSTPDRCPRCGSSRNMIAAHIGPSRNLAEASDDEFTAFLERAAFGCHFVGTRQISIGFELPWLGYDNDKVREGLNRLAPELQVQVPHRKVGETRGPGGDLLVIAYQHVFEIATDITVWAAMGALIKKAVEYLRSESPQVLINEGAALSIGAASIYDLLGKVALDYAFVINSHQLPQNTLTLRDHAYLIGFQSKRRVAWAIVSDEGGVIAVEHAPRSRAPGWWEVARDTDRRLAATPLPRGHEL